MKTFPEQIKQYLRESCPWQDSLLWYPQIDSTNTHARELARQGAPHGTVLLADSQTGGRGRMGRQFHSPAGSGIYMSVILRPNCRPGEIMHLTCAAAVAMTHAIARATGADVGIKWTNDLVFGKRKLGGILTELGLKPDGTLDYAIIGVGINCCQKPGDFPEDIRSMATSLAQITGEPVSRAKLAAAMMDAFFTMSQTLFTGREGMLTEYRQRCVTLGQEISVLQGDTLRHGKALDIDGSGALIMENPSGTQEVLRSGEVSIRGMYGYI